MACLAASFAFGLSPSPDLSFALPRGDTEGASNQTFRLIVKPDLWSKTIRLRFSNTFGQGRQRPSDVALRCVLHFLPDRAKQRRPYAG